MTTKQSKSMIDKEREAYALVGRHGGLATFKKHGKNHMRDIGKRGAKKRWLKKSTDRSDS